MRHSILILWASLLLSGVAQADEGDAGEGPYFYKGRAYGTESLVHPLRLIINGGYGIMQLDNRENRPLDLNYGRGLRTVWRNISDPAYAIQDKGWGDFFQREIIPVSFNSGKAQYWPNYTQHLIGGGMSYRMMAEWFDYNNYARPKLWAGATIFAYHFLNEVVEASYFPENTPSTDAVADLLIFDPLSVLLFSSDRVSRFFGETLNMNDWSYQPAFDPWHQTLQNNGQNFMLRYFTPLSDRNALFYHFGTHAEGGISVGLGEERFLSVAVGLKAKELVTIDRGTSTVDLGLTGGIFYDRGGSLLASLLMASTKDYAARLNIYPGFLPTGSISPGFFLALDRDEELVGGITFDFLPHLPLGLAGSNSREVGAHGS